VLDVRAAEVRAWDSLARSTDFSDLTSPA
jgi:hypothetical protein